MNKLYAIAYISFLIGGLCFWDGGTTGEYIKATWRDKVVIGVFLFSLMVLGFLAGKE